MHTRELPNPTDLTAVRRWLAEHTPDVREVGAWTARVLHRMGAIPDLGSPEWTALADTDTRKLAAALRPALAQLLENTPGAIRVRLRREFDDRATAWRCSIVELHADLSRGWHDLGYGIGPSHADLVRRRDTYPCGQCRRPLRTTATACACGWHEPTPEQLQASARDSWARPTSQGAA